jgi:glucose-6-phosphate 1-epimerase
MKKKYSANDGATIEVSTFGGHLLSWRDVNLQEFLYVSPKAIFDDITPIRGGVPICFPKFGAFDGKNEVLSKLKSHGFLRQVNWQFESAKQINNLHVVELSYNHNDTQANFIAYPYIFKATLIISFNNSQLNMELYIHNLDAKSMEYTIGFHPYFMFNIATDSLLNLAGLSGKNPNNEDVLINQNEFIIDKETNLVFQKIAKLPVLKTKDYSLNFSINNLQDMVIWNPYTNPAIKDLDENSYTQFVCIEPVGISTQSALQPNKVATHGFSVIKS